LQLQRLCRPGITRCVGGFHADEIQHWDLFEWKGPVQARIVGVQFRATKRFEVGQNRVAALLLGNPWTTLRNVFLWLVNQTSGIGIKAEAQGFGEVPTQVVVAIPGESAVVVGIFRRVFARKTVGSNAFKTLQVRVKPVGVRNGVEIEFRNELQVFVLFDQLFERHNRLDTRAVLPIQTTFVLFLRSLRINGVAFFLLVVGVGNAEVFNVPGERDFARFAFTFFAYIGEVVAFHHGHVLCALAIVHAHPASAVSRSLSFSLMSKS
jgi:hypothetical protein